MRLWDRKVQERRQLDDQILDVEGKLSTLKSTAVNCGVITFQRDGVELTFNPQSESIRVTASDVGPGLSYDSVADLHKWLGGLLGHAAEDPTS